MGKINRTEKVIFTVEEIVKDILDRQAAKEERSVSDYVRSLVVRDFHDKGLLPVDIMLELIA